MSSGSVASQRRGDAYLDAGDLGKAMECYRQALAADPRNGQALLSLGMGYFREGAWSDAEQHLRQAISSGAASSQAHYFLGSALLKQGKPDEAAIHFNGALQLQPDADIVYGDLCQALVLAGRHEEALYTVKGAVSRFPGLADLYLVLGRLLSQAKDFDRAGACYRERLALDPRHVHALYFLAEALQNSGDIAGAADSYRRVLALQPDFAEACNNLGGIYFNHQGDPLQAMDCFHRALATRPDVAEIHLNLGLVHKACGRFADAAASYAQAIALKPGLAEAHRSLATLFVEQGQAAQAEAAFLRALEIEPDDADACYGLAVTLASSRGRELESMARLRQALALNPEHFTARTMLLHHLQQMCNWGELDQHARILRQAIDSRSVPAKYKFLPLVFLAIPGTTAAEQKYCAERYVEAEYRSLSALRATLPPESRNRRDDRIRIGYLSADFRQHPVSFLMAEVFELHDRDRFHVTAYSYGPDDGSPMRKRLEQSFDRFVDLRDASYEAAARRIRDDGTDILVDLTGHTEDSRSAILALRPAPVQVNYLGYPGTMGADFVDYMIADEFTVPTGMRRHYSEKIVCMPDCFQANDGKRPRPPAPTRPKCGLPDDGFVFCCFNQTFKITPDFFDAWCRLLRETPGGVLWLPASNPHAEANLRREAASRGVAAERIVMAPLKPRDEHLARVQCADLFLDTLPFNAGTTCSDALWMGVPVITCTGETFAGRMAGSLLRAIGAPELVTCNLDEYYRLALDLATDRTKYAAIRDKISANRDASPVFDSARFTRNLENTYLQMMAERAAN